MTGQHGWLGVRYVYKRRLQLYMCGRVLVSHRPCLAGGKGADAGEPEPVGEAAVAA
jgi:hypothetical protein